MPRNMSFSLTTEQVRNKTKTVTRRLGWDGVKVGDILTAVEKAQGLKKGEHVKVICQIRVTGKRKESLMLITDDDIIREGFPGMSIPEFVLMFTVANKCTVNEPVNRIEFEYI